MASNGANACSVPLGINNLEAQIKEGVVGVASVSTSGAGLSASSGTGAVTLTNTGVTSIVAGSNVTISGGVGGTGAVTINATPTSVVSNGAVSASSFALPPNGDPLTLTASQIGNAFCYNNIRPSFAHTLYLPNATALTAQFGANAVVNFFIGQMNVTVFNIPLAPTSALQTLVTSPTGNEFWANNYTTQAPSSPLTAVTFTNYTSSTSLHFPAVYKVQVTIQGGKAFYYFAYAGFNSP